jgi:tRNA dimethylallyltransferase
VKEVKALYTPNNNIENLHAMKAIGYLEIIKYLQDHTPINVEQIKQRTRNYAKRQMTWIKHHYKNLIIFNQENYLEILSHIKA